MSVNDRVKGDTELDVMQTDSALYYCMILLPRTVAVMLYCRK